jgi:hypothetical protein
MGKWLEILEGIGEVAQGLGDVAVFNNWMQMDDAGAFNSIEAQIRCSDVSTVDRMDASLLQYANVQIDPYSRMRAIKFYSFFKLVEFNNYGFRGYPQ